MSKYLENLQEAEKKAKAIDHMIYVSFPLIRDKRLLLQAITESKVILTKCINAILQYEYLHKRIRLSSDVHINLRTFKEKCAPKYTISLSEIKQIDEIFNLVEKHKQSGFEFFKDNKLIILSNGFQPNTLSLEKIKEFIALTKNILKKAKIHIPPEL